MTQGQVMGCCGFRSLTHCSRLSHMQTHAHIVVHSTSDEEALRARRFLQEHNVSHISFVSEFSSAVKTAMVNDFIRSMPRDGWLLYADSDVSPLPDRAH